MRELLPADGETEARVAGPCIQGSGLSVFARRTEGGRAFPTVSTPSRCSATACPSPSAGPPRCLWVSTRIPPLLLSLLSAPNCLGLLLRRDAGLSRNPPGHRHQTEAFWGLCLVTEQLLGSRPPRRVAGQLGPGRNPSLTRPPVISAHSESALRKSLLQDGSPDWAVGGALVSSDPQSCCMGACVLIPGVG